MNFDDVFLVDIDRTVEKEKERFKKFMKEAKRKKKLLDSGVKECDLEEHIRREDEEKLNEKIKRLKRKEAKKKTEDEKKRKKKKKTLYLSKVLKEEVKERDGYKCTKCDSNEELHVHHIIHRENGGTNDKSNLITLCEECHIKEHEGENIEHLMKKRREIRVNSYITLAK